MFKLLLIWRYLLRKHVAIIAIIAVMMVVMMVLVVLSIMSGLINEVKRRNHQWASDIIISRDSLVGFPYYEDFISTLDRSNITEAATPVIKTFALAGPDHQPGMVLGIKMSSFCKVTSFASSLQHLPAGAKPSFTLPIVEDNYSGSTLTAAQRQRGCITGIWSNSTWPQFMRSQVWYKGHLTQYLPQQLTFFGIGPTGALKNETGDFQTFWYLDDSRTGLVDIDSSVTYVDFDILQKLCWMAGTDNTPKRTSEIRIKIKPGIPLNRAQTKIAELWQQFATQHKNRRYASLLNDVKIQTWRQYRRSNIAPMEREQSLMIVIFCLIGLVATFIVFAIFYMIVTEKIKDLGIIRSMGSSRWDTGMIFLGYGLLIGIIGTGLGTLLGYLFVSNVNTLQSWVNEMFGFQLWPKDLYAISKIPDIVYPQQAFAIALTAVLACMLASVAPAWRAGHFEVVESLRCE